MEFMPNFQLHRPETIEDAVKARADNDDALYFAGGTDMLVNVRRGIEQPQNLVDLSAITGMKSITLDNDGLHIGASVTLKELRDHETVVENYTAISQSAKAVAGATHQMYGTLGGNLCLDTRCLFYNQSEWWRQSNDYCLKERGDTCHVAPGGKRCFAAFSGDMAPSMLVYDAEVDIASEDGIKRMPLIDLYQNDGLDHLTLKPGELLTAVHLPQVLAGDPSAYEKARVRGSIDFPLAGAAVRLRTSADGLIEDLAIALTAVNPYPQIVSGLEGLIGAKLSKESAMQVRDTVRKQAKPMRTTTVAPWYRRRVIGAITKRLVEELAG
ncbi:MAG: FAD binding domain-containing protein [Rhodospirillales bacterium]|nr:FAD binding domain-containing protein [Rhodospirillales bacterium]